MIKLNKFVIAVVIIGAAASSPAQNLLRQNNSAYMPDEWLLGNGQPWHHRAMPKDNGKNIGTRQPTMRETGIIDEIRRQFSNLPSKAILLGDGDNIVWTEFKQPANDYSIFLSASIDKTVTAMSAGVAVCADKISLNTKAKDVLPELRGSDIGESTLKNNLMMASGTTRAFDDSQSMTREESLSILSGQLHLMELMRGRWSKQQGWNKPGQVFDYKSQDPYLVGMMVSAAYGEGGKNFRRWQEEYFFPKVGVQDRRVQSQDRQGYAQSDGTTRLTLKDWARFAAFVTVARKESGCYGNFVRDATKTQIRTDRRFAKMYDGYGYFVWTDNNHIPNSFSALGYGGQAIIWSTVNNKYFIIFSNNVEPGEIHRMAKLWLE